MEYISQMEMCAAVSVVLEYILVLLKTSIVVDVG